VTARTALALVTYVDKRRPPAVRERLRRAIESLERTDYHDPVVIVDDASTCEKHLEYLDRLAKTGRYEVVRRECNGGISRAKNTCLRVIVDVQPRVGFLAEDDILFHKGWRQAYLAAMRSSQVQHFSWYPYQPHDRVVACNGGLVTATSGLLGLLLTFTPELVSTMGGFKVLPHAYGYEHIQWTYRAILAGFAPFPCDIVDSGRFIERSVLPTSLDGREIEQGVLGNRAGGYVIDRVFERLEE
jgi:glycosyltransferase involved in cell wall biosynthesis